MESIKKLHIMNNKEMYDMNKDEVLLDKDDLAIGSEYEEKIKDYPLENLKVDKGFYTAFELKRKYEKKMIKLDDDFQRDDVWSLQQKIELVESVLMGLPLPIFYFNQDKKGVLIVVDGRQRLTALFSYMNDDFKLSELKILPKKYEKKFSELDPIYQTKLEDYQIQAHVILPPTPERVKFDIFDRVNRAGTQLNKQEIRNALYQGNSTHLLKEIVESELFITATEKGLVKDKRMKARYLILRYISFYLLRTDKLMDSKGNLYTYKTIDELLAFTMEIINSYEEIELVKLQNVINSTLDKCIYYVNKDAFRLNQNGKRSPINMNVFETICYILSFLSKELPVEKVHNKLIELKEDKNFLINIGNHRDSEANVKARFDMADKIVEELLK